MIDYLINNLTSYVIGFIVVIGLIIFLTPAARKAGLVDLPTHRKQHASDVPLIGGIAIFLAFSLSLLLVDASLAQIRPLLFVGSLVVLLGVLDDYLDIEPLQKLGGQFGLITLLVFNVDVYVTDIGEIFPGIHLVIHPAIGAGLTILALVALLNAFNMIDGIDGMVGLATTISLFALLFLYFRWPYNYELEFIISMGLVIACVSGFLLFNLGVFGQRRKIFLGDAGSMICGLFVGYFCLEFVGATQAEERIILAIAAVPWIVGLPIMDMFHVVLARTIGRRSPFKAGRDHIHHILLDLRVHPLIVVLCLGFVHSMLVAAGILAASRKISEPVSFGIYVAVLCGFVVVARILAGLVVEDDRGEDSYTKVVQLDTKMGRDSR